MMTKEEQATHRAIQRIGQKIPDVTLRDLFAMNIASGVSAHYISQVMFSNNFCAVHIAEMSYKIADAMLEARGKENG